MIFRLPNKIYKTLFEISFEHDFYADRAVKQLDLEVISLNDNARILQNYKLACKYQDNKMVILQECDPSSEPMEAIIPFDENLKFGFIILQKNPLFQNFTELPFFKPKSEALYFNNLNCKPSPEKQFLSKKENITTDDLYPLFPKTFEYQPKKSNTEITVWNVNNECIFRANASETKLSINLTNESNGLYTIKENKTTTLTFLSIEPIVNQIIGYFELFVTPKQINYFNNPKATVLSHYICFKSREIFWKYTVVKKYNDIAKTRIVDDLEQLNFKHIDAETQKNTKIFVSEKKIAFKENNEFIFKLITQNGNSKFEKILYEKLALPSVSNIEKYNDDFAANVFVYA